MIPALPVNSELRRQAIKPPPSLYQSVTVFSVLKWAVVLAALLLLLQAHSVCALNTPTAASTAADASNEGLTGSPIKHVVVLYEENHAFDNYFGTYPGANGLNRSIALPVTKR